MKSTPIKNHSQLQERLQLLFEKELFYRKRVLSDAGEIIEIIRDPAPLIKKTVKDLASDSKFRTDLFTIAIEYLFRFLAEKFGRSGDVQNWFEKLLNKFRTSST
jgi:hypothetical protein